MLSRLLQQMIVVLVALVYTNLLRWRVRFRVDNKGIGIRFLLLSQWHKYI